LFIHGEFIPFGNTRAIDYIVALNAVDLLFAALHTSEEFDGRLSTPAI
tara:strand:- start:362 stop:505 length:144 start_codon:yes stop_codon:yes gene_type:complete